MKVRFTRTLRTARSPRLPTTVTVLPGGRRGNERLIEIGSVVMIDPSLILRQCTSGKHIDACTKRRELDVTIWSLVLKRSDDEARLANPTSDLLVHVSAIIRSAGEPAQRARTRTSNGLSSRSSRPRSIPSPPAAALWLRARVVAVMTAPRR